MNPCQGRTSACVAGPTQRFGFGIYRRDLVDLCPACAAVMLATGFPIEPERRRVERQERVA